MRRFFAYISAALVLLSLTACGEPSPKEISCEQIIKAYEDAGYYVTHGKHYDESESNYRCYIKASLEESSDGDYIYFITCFTEEQAKEIAQTDEYNVVKWLFAAPMGESRWLQSGTYGKIEYTYYNSELIKPFSELIE